MAALTSIASLVGAGASLYAQQQQVDRSRDVSRAQAQINAQAEQQRQQQLSLAQTAERTARAEQVARTVASARARLAAGGVSPDDGSAAAVAAGLRGDAARAQADSDEMFRARLSAGRASLLNPDGSTVPLLRALPSFGYAVRNLLD